MAGAPASRRHPTARSGTRLMVFRPPLALVALAASLCIVPALRAQDVTAHDTTAAAVPAAAAPGAEPPRYRTAPAVLRSVPARFRIEGEARTALRAMWDASLAARVEYVACLGGSMQDGAVRIDRIRVLEAEGADSLGVPAGRSIEECGTPDWLGTVHTHIARYDGERPYPTFSGADRGVMLMWWRRWKTDGVFCVLYTEKAAHCEVDGVERQEVLPGGSY